MDQKDAQQIVSEALAGDAIRTASALEGFLTINLATITLLVDAGIVTVEQAVQRMQQVHPALRADPVPAEQNPLLLAAITWLRERDPQNTPAPQRLWRPQVHQGGAGSEKPPG